MAQVRFFLATEGSMRFGGTCRTCNCQGVLLQFFNSLLFFYICKYQMACLWPAVYEGHLIILSNIYINVYVEQSEHKICY